MLLWLLLVACSKTSGVDTDTGTPYTGPCTADDPDADRDGACASADCDDADPFVFLGAAESCDGKDDDCDGEIDEEYDRDGDGVTTCAATPDCDDRDGADYPGNVEICDGRDNDCDGQMDEGFDGDGDTWTSCGGDCDDGDASVHPGQPEACNGREDDCDPSTSDYDDQDGDGLTYCDGDCLDTDPTAFPGADDACGDGLDQDCDGYADDAYACLSCTTADPYTYCTASVDWATAEATCEHEGATLVILGDADENTAVSSVAWGLTGGNASWIGLTDADSEGTFVWVDGEPATYAAWNSGEPNDYGGVEDCAGTNYGAEGGWNDFDCAGYALPFVCEAAPL